MLSVKQELLGSLVAELEQLSPGAGARAAFESPKVAAHGDFACTAAMQLAKPLKLNPRQVAENLRTALLATPAYQQWVEAIEKTVSTRLEPGEAAGAFVERAAALATLGVEHLVVLTRGPWTSDSLSVLVDAAADIADIPAAATPIGSS